jgi:hypothetical protein
MPVHGETSGAIWVPDTCGFGERYGAACATPPYGAFTLDGMENVAQAYPFVAYATLVTARPGYSNAEALRRVEQRLINTEQTMVERALWGGDATLFTGQRNFAGTMPGTAGGGGAAGVAGGVLQQLANIGAAAGFQDLTATACATVAEGVSLLEQSAADNYYGQAVIHARPRLASFFGRSGLIRVVGLPPAASPGTNNMFTQNLNVINFGNGYTGVGPTGQAADQTPVTGNEYMYATGRVCVWQGDIITSEPDQLLDKTSDQRGLYAWRPYLVGIECFAACVKVTRV